MKVYVDNDIAVKLAKWGLLSRFTTHLVKQGKAELFMVPTLRYKFKLADRPKALALLGSATAVDQLAAFVQACRPALGHNQAVANALVDVPAVDAGEAALLAAAAHYDAALVDTGDKAALRAVASLGAGHVAVLALAGKLACLEQTVHYLIGRWSFDVVRVAVASCAAADEATRRCFDGGAEGQVLAALANKTSELRPQCCNLLAETPFGWIA